MEGNYLGVQLTLHNKQRIIDIFSEYYSQEDIFAVGRLIGIDKNKYYGFGMNAVQLAEVFVNTIVQQEKISDLYELIEKNKTYYRTEFDEFLHVKDEMELSKRMCKNLHAIIIGINEYDLGAGSNNLRFAAEDSKAISLFLKLVWNISEANILEFSSKANYADLMQSIKDMCSRLSEKDNLLFFFSGHGKEVAGHSYLAVTDTGFDSSGSIYNAISLDELNTIIRGCKANLKLRFFDACQCGESFSKEFTSDHKMTETMKKQFLESGNGWITFCSCDINEYSRELPRLHHGAFTYCVLEGLKGAARRGSEKMYIEDLKIYVCENVPKLVNNPLEPQNPQYQCEVECNILIE